MTLLSASSIEQSLQRVGDLLAAEGETVAVVIVGGAALNLLRIVERPTVDVDVLAFADAPTLGSAKPSGLREPPEPLPVPLRRAIAQVARDGGLPPDWMNAGPALQWRSGLPPGLASRVSWRRMAGLWLGIVGREDLIHLKLFAAADATSTRSVHYQDLLRLAPIATELEAAAAWVATQDASPSFASVLARVVAQVRRDLHAPRAD